jgi:hypothetical protein
MNELILIKQFLNKATYEKYSKYLSLDYIRHNYPEIHKIFIVLDKFHQQFDLENDASVDDLKAYFFSQYPALKKGEVDGYNAIFNRIDEVEIQDVVVDQVLEAHRQRSSAFKLASIGFDVSEGKRDFGEFRAAFTESEQDFRPVESPIEFVTDSLDELHQATYAKPGVKWKLKTLRKMMGSLRKGDMGFIFTRPEVGKTTLLADQGSYFAHQLDGPYIHFNNEELGHKVKIRYMQAALGKTTRELFADKEANEKRYLDFTNNQIKIYDAAAIEKSDVEEICERLQPRFIVFDSIDKIKGFTEDRDDLVYKQIYAWARELAKDYGPVIGVCHASVSAERKRWLEMDDVAYAKTAKQGEADWILGIGALYEAGQEFIRHLHLPKNKLMGDDEMDENFRHGKLDVRIFPEIAQYDDLLQWD